MEHKLKTGVAIAVTVVCCLMAVSASLERGATVFDKSMIAATVLVMVASSHILPGIMRSLGAYVVFSGCLMVTLYSHACFFSGVAERLGQANVQSAAKTPQEIAIEQKLLTFSELEPQDQLLKKVGAAKTELTLNQNRLIACKKQWTKCPSAQLAVSSAQERVAGLEGLLQRAKARDELINQLAEQGAKHEELRTKKIDLKIGQWIGIKADDVTIIFALFQAALLELIGVFLWKSVLGNKNFQNDERNKSDGLLETPEEPGTKRTLILLENTQPKILVPVADGMVDPKDYFLLQTSKPKRKRVG